jgi:LPPG:FO 2-phospho-L-lactate transferase
MILALAGGVGGARLAFGLSRVLSPSELVIAVNTGDDFEHLGLAISPDIDTVCYTLAGLENQKMGWGRRDETWAFMQTLSAFGGEDWFQLGDRDLALHVLRTRLKAAGDALSTVTRVISERLGVGARVLPMTDDRVATIIETSSGPLAFQDYFVRQQCRPVATGFHYEGADVAQVQPSLRDAFSAPNLEAIILCPSNPWLSIGPMRAIPALEQALVGRLAPCVVVSPIVGGKAVKGPAAKLMAELGLEISALSIARHYVGIADVFVIDTSDAGLTASIEALGFDVLVTETLMHGDAERIALAETILARLR